jgi:hypothetical protein
MLIGIGGAARARNAAHYSTRPLSTADGPPTRHAPAGIVIENVAR